jgi:hypothetical protein
VGGSDPVHFEIVSHDSEDIEISGRWLDRNEATPDEATAEGPRGLSEFYECLEAAQQPYAPWGLHSKTLRKVYSIALGR